MLFFLFFFFFFSVARMLRLTNSRIHLIIEENISSLVKRRRRRKKIFFFRRETFDSFTCIHTSPIIRCVCCTSSSINVRKESNDGSSNHRDKKVPCVCVCPNLELAQIIDFTPSCLRDISGDEVLFSLSLSLSLFLLDSLTEENECNNCFSVR